MEQNNPGGAVVFFKNALEKNNTDFSIRLDLAKAYFRMGKIDQAEEEFRKCLLQKPEDPELNLELAKLSLAQRNPGQMLEHISVAEKSANPTEESRELAALALSMLNRHSEAEKALNEALAIAPQQSSAQLALAHVYLAQNRIEDAILLLDKILEANPNYSNALRTRGDIAVGMNDIPKAEEYFRKVQELRPNDVDSYYKLGMTLLQQNKTAAALSLLDEMKSKFAESPQEYLLRGIYAYQTDDFAEAATLFQNSVDKGPSMEGYYRLALAQHRLGNNESALSSLRHLLDVAPRSAPALQLYTQVLRVQGRLDDAMASAERLVMYHPNNAAGHFLLGNILKDMGKSQASLDALEKALALNPGMSEAVLTRSSILMAEKRFDEATEVLSNALKADSSNISARVALFNYYMGRRDMRAAERIVNEGLRDLPDNPMLLTLRAIYLVGMKKEDEALATVRKAREKDPDLLAAINLELRLHMLAGRTGDALALTDSYLARHPNATDQLIASASLLDSLDRRDEATQRLQKAYDLGANRAFTMLVQRELVAKRPEKAEELFFAAMKSKPSPELRTLFAEFYLGTGQFDKALGIFDAIATTYPAEAALGKYRLFFASRKFEEALSQARAAKQLDSNSPAGVIAVANSLEHLGKTSEALAELESAYRATQSPLFMRAMAQLCLRTEQYDKAESFFGTALRLNPKDVPSLTGQGYLALRNKKYTEAIGNYERVLELAPNDIAAMNNLAMAYAEEGKNTGKAVDLAIHAVMLQPENLQILDTLGFSLLADNRVDEAVNILRNGIKTNPDSGLLRFRLGTALIRANKKQEGVTELKKALELGGFSYQSEAKQLITKNS